MKTRNLLRMQAAAFLILPLLQIGCAKPRASDGVPLSQQPNTIILLRGAAGDVFSKGMDELGDRLRREGHPIIVESHANWITLASARGENDRPCRAIIGHSFGADNAIDIARSLNSKGVQVEYLFLFDPRFPTLIPPNVRYCWNFMSPVPIGNGVPVLPELGNTRTMIVNDVKWNLGHLDIDDSAALQNFIVDKLRRG